MPLPETKKGGVYNAVLMTIEERPGATEEMFADFLRKHSVPDTDIETVREPYHTKPGFHYHAVVLRGPHPATGKKRDFKVDHWLVEANKTSEFKGLQFNYWPNTRKLCGTGFAAKAMYCKKYLRDPSKNKITGEVHIVRDPVKERCIYDAQMREDTHIHTFGRWWDGDHYDHNGDLCKCSGGHAQAGGCYWISDGIL